MNLLLFRDQVIKGDCCRVQTTNYLNINNAFLNHSHIKSLIYVIYEKYSQFQHSQEINNHWPTSNFYTPIYS